MTKHPNIDDRALLDLVKRHAGEDFLRELLSWALHQVMEAEVGEITGAGKGERSPEERANLRNGYRRRDWDTRVGTIPLNIPKLREGSYMPSFMEPRRTSERAFAATIQEAYVNGVSTRSVDRLVQAMGASGVSKSQVSRLCEELDERVSAFRAQPIEGEWPYLWLDATYLKSRADRRIMSRATIIAVGANLETGCRAVLGVETGASEAETFWLSLLRNLADRGLRGVKLVIADDHSGLRAAAGRVFAGATLQRCRVHWMRNALDNVPVAQRPAVRAQLKTVFAEESQDKAVARWNSVAEEMRGRHSRLADLMDASRDDVLAYMGFPKAHWTKICSTNPLERVNCEVKRRTKAVGIFPNDEAIVRLVGAMMIETSDEWAAGRRYMSPESLAEIVSGEDDAPADGDA